MGEIEGPAAKGEDDPAEWFRVLVFRVLGFRVAKGDNDPAEWFRVYGLGFEG
jgi:hypothetical protein